MVHTFIGMSEILQAPALEFPYPAPPPDGEMLEIRPGILWLRLALPFQLNHVNIYLIEDGDGWAVIDTGVSDARTRAVWEGLLAGRLRERKVTRLIVTHFHPDHVGLAGWLAERCAVPTFMSQTEFLMAGNVRYNANMRGHAAHRGFYRHHGLDEATIAALTGRGQHYLNLTTDPPPVYQRLQAGDRITIGQRRFEVMTGAGHAPEMLMFLCRDEGLFLAADQVLARISPNIGVWPNEPLANPLGAYLASLAALREMVPDDVLVLAAHNLPFRRLHQRIDELAYHHAQRLADVARAVADGPLTTAEILPVLFPRALDPHQAGFAFGETLAHVNYMVATGALEAVEADGVVRFV